MEFLYRLDSTCMLRRSPVFVRNWMSCNMSMTIKLWWWCNKDQRMLGVSGRPRLVTAAGIKRHPSDLVGLLAVERDDIPILICITHTHIYIYICTRITHFLSSSIESLFKTNAIRVSHSYHQMETFSALLALCAGNSPVTAEFTTQRPVTRGFGVLFGLSLNKRLSKVMEAAWRLAVSVCSSNI